MYSSGVLFCFIKCCIHFYSFYNIWSYSWELFIWATNHLGNIILSAPYFTWQPSMAFLLFGHFLFLPAILSFLFSNLSLQRVCFQRTSSSSQCLINPEKLLSHPILIVSYKNRHPERLECGTTMIWTNTQFWPEEKEIPCVIISLNFNPYTVFKEL